MRTIEEIAYAATTGCAPTEDEIRRLAKYILVSKDVERSKDETAWLVELGCLPPQWWTGRAGDMFSGDANDAMRFARREDAEVAIAWLVEPGTRRGCKALEHMWISKS
jgi:hypothetical protein